MESAPVSIPKPKKSRKKLWRRLGIVAAVCFACWLGLVGYVNWAMRQPPAVFAAVMAKMPMPAFFVLPFETLWGPARAGHLNPGDQAPDFTLKQLQGAEAPQNLAGLWQEKPVVLVFGSYT
ncbi:MAG TPA: hypothetical protein VGJ21_18880 [Terracidiphilus sp.]|jgi:hypothetical protein